VSKVRARSHTFLARGAYALRSDENRCIGEATMSSLFGLNSRTIKRCESRSLTATLFRYRRQRPRRERWSFGVTIARNYVNGDIKFPDIYGLRIIANDTAHTSIRPRAFNVMSILQSCSSRVQRIITRSRDISSLGSRVSSRKCLVRARRKSDPT